MGRNKVGRRRTRPPSTIENIPLYSHDKRPVKMVVFCCLVISNNLYTQEFHILRPHFLERFYIHIARIICISRKEIYFMKTKDKIISEATKAFNKNGFGAVSLQELAQKTGISRGNLTYHFKDKDALLQAISDKMWEQMKKEKEKSRSFPSFENLKAASISLVVTSCFF